MEHIIQAPTKALSSTAGHLADRAQVSAHGRSGVGKQGRPMKAYAVVLAICVCVAAIFFARNAPQVAPRIATPAAEATTSQARIEVSNIRATPPAPGAPIDSYFNQLSLSARAGDIAAACRIAADIQRCQADEEGLDIADDMSQIPGARAEILNSIVRSAETTMPVCAGLRDQVRNQAFEFQLQAAQSRTEYARWLVAKPALDQQNFLGNLEGWEQYRRFASKYFADAIEHKSTQDLSLLLLVYAPRSFGFARPPYQIDDPPTFIALYRLSRRLGVQIPPPVHLVAQRVIKRGDPTFEEKVSAAEDALGQWPPLSRPDETLMHFVPPDSAAFCR